MYEGRGVVRQTITVPGTLAGATRGREWTRDVIGDSAIQHPDERAAIERVVDAFTTNAVRHTASGDTGGEITVELDISGIAASIRVRDQGPTERAHEPAPSEQPSGLAAVADTAQMCGYHLDDHGGTAWAVLDLGSTHE